MNDSIALRGISWDAKSSYLRGPAQAPPLIRERLWSPAYNAYTESGAKIEQRDLIDLGDLEPADYFDIETWTEEHLRQYDSLLTLGGDHSITYPIMRAISKKYPGLTILQIDAHADLYDEYEGDRYSHACPFARIMEEGLVSRLVQIGVRTLTPHQRAQGQRYGVETIEMLQDYTAAIATLEAPIYVTLDMDGFDPAFAPGVSHQECGGLFPRQVLDILYALSGKIVSADIVEYNPVTDHSGITAALAAKMAKEIVPLMKGW